MKITMDLSAEDIATMYEALRMSGTGTSKSRAALRTKFDMAVLRADTRVAPDTTCATRGCGHIHELHNAGSGCVAHRCPCADFT